MNFLKNSIRTVKNASPILFTIVMLHVVGGIICIGGLLIDDRTLAGVNVWVKPLKFCISGAIYIFTVGFLMTKYPYSTRKKNILNNIISWTLLLEIGIIFYQASRGVQSHYNQDSLFDGLLFAAMGILIAINVLLMVLFAFDAARLKMKVAKPVQVAIFIGWVVVIVGSWVGGQMISQMAHNVGVADGGDGLPLVNWSTVAGDLRVAHFFGLHGIQIIPLFALILSRKWKTTTKNQVITTIIFGLLYAAWITHMFYQAKQGLPLY
ncbi:hypothetical protein [uncultured Kordia sp.]|uniref:hypothetical protein n=1 Tax=uncultured Kordia sp. TaxID=507699 RepID=UPI0026136FDF|nr:hypothetical protein [uncultured Kordia sp.]